MPDHVPIPAAAFARRPLAYAVQKKITQINEAHSDVELKMRQNVVLFELLLTLRTCSRFSSLARSLWFSSRTELC